jgi:hypothetical protein
VDIAVDPLDGTTLTAQGRSGAISVRLRASRCVCVCACVLLLCVYTCVCIHVCVVGVLAWLLVLQL